MSDRPKKGIELNTVQLVSSMAAAVTGAVLTSYLGDGGTILGTAVGSGVSTAGFAVYKHYLSRTKEKVAPVIVEHARQRTPTGTEANVPHPAHPGGVTRADATRADATRADATRADAARGSDATRVDRSVGSNGNGQAATAADWEQARRTAPGWAEPTRAEPGWGPDVTRQDVNPTRQDSSPGQTTRQDFGQPRYIPHPAQPEDEQTRTARYDNTRYGTVRMGDGTLVNGGPGGPGSGGSGSDGPGPGGGAGDGRHGKPGGVRRFFADRPPWVWTVASAAVVFIIALVIITVFELGTGKPISSTVWNRSGTGTTLGGGSSTTTKPTQGATPTQSATAPSVGATNGGSSNATPSQQPSPTVSPSSVPTVGTTRGATAPASGGFGGNGAGSGAAAPGQ